jgi:hypothetical protein
MFTMTRFGMKFNSRKPSTIQGCRRDNRIEEMGQLIAALGVKFNRPAPKSFKVSPEVSNSAVFDKPRVGNFKLNL